VKAIILAGGYATRLRPLTDDLSKCLLPVGGRPMLDWILDRVEQVEEIDEVHVVTNQRFAQDFEHWAMFKPGVTVHDDGTTSNEDRLGAIGDIAFTLEQAGIVDDDVIVIAGDNLFDYDLQSYVDFWRGKGVASAVAIRDVGDLRLASQYGVVALDDDDRVIEFVEKPAHPTSTLCATATYIYHREHVPLVGRYLAEGNPPDQSGSFFEWLRAREPVYGYWFTGVWLDIGDKEQLLAADNILRRAQGLPERDEYVLEFS
jgi:glucose-1-phosphate thymidylyltransferase